ncbi:DUF6220 domain-containing protein [Chamaesiphon sp.]|uniref:DUF6220 domain-containing protein n=1 Tax=Chamaesiphon sp. TaxID=2814140 RepID=UPI003593E92F
MRFGQDKTGGLCSTSGDFNRCAVLTALAVAIDLHSDRTKLSGWIQKGFLAIAVLFNLCLIAQLLTVGLAVFDDPTWWHIHVLLVRGYSGLVILLLVGLSIDPFSQKIKMLTVGLVTLGICLRPRFPKMGMPTKDVKNIGHINIYFRGLLCQFKPDPK